MNTKHTPGPWGYQQSHSDTCLFEVTPEHIGTYLEFGTVAGEYGVENEADARLIAAAPELLAALQGLLPVTFTGNPTRAAEVAHWTREKELGNGEAAAVLAAYAAIAKAIGSPAC